MWPNGWRDEIWNQANDPWDILVIGGGITGAGVFNLAARTGLRVLLVDASDFAFGTSSRSSKLVHGGFRYLRNRQFSVTRESVRERERLVHQAKYLVDPLQFLLPVIGGRKTTRQVYRMGVTIYDLLAPKWVHGHLNGSALHQQYPQLTNPRVTDGFFYYDAEVDDSRLVLRVLQEGIQAGGKAMNYTRVDHLLLDSHRQVCGAAIQDRSVEGNGRTAEIRAQVVINATGPWTDELREQVGGEKRIRKQRGSHLAFPKAKLPLQQAITFFHPRDKRAMFVFPWEGVTLIGTTDLDHPLEMEEAHSEPVITRSEVTYMMEAIEYLFPQAQMGESDIVSTFAGLRPIVSSGMGNPSKESRAHSLWDENGLVTITGGKLTTYRLMAYHTLQSIRNRLPRRPVFNPLLPLFQTPPRHVEGVQMNIWKRLAGRFGQESEKMIATAGNDELEYMPELPTTWAEVRWAAREEAIEHLDDLLLRRLRLGLIAPKGGLTWIDRIRAIAQPELGWDDTRWQVEEERYRQLWQECYYGI